MIKSDREQETTSINHLTYIAGDIRAEDDIIINGKVNGKVKAKKYDVLLGPRGQLKGNIYGKDVKIRGQMKGEIHATGRVEIAREAKFSGKIISKSVSVERGAYFDANVDLGRKSPEQEIFEVTPGVSIAPEKSKVK